MCHEMESWNHSLCSFQFSYSLTCATCKSFQNGKQNEPRFDSAPNNLHVRQGVLVFGYKSNLKVHCKISKIFIILTWWYNLLICHHLLIAVTICSPHTETPCISWGHLFPFFLQTRHLEDHYRTSIDNCYKVLSCLALTLSLSTSCQHVPGELLLVKYSWQSLTNSMFFLIWKV